MSVKPMAISHRMQKEMTSVGTWTLDTGHVVAMMVGVACKVASIILNPSSNGTGYER